MIKRALFTATALLVSAATPALAQQHQHGQEQEPGTMGPQSMMMQCMHAMMGTQDMGALRGMMGAEGMGGMMGEMMQGGMMRVMRTQPAMLLQASEALGLTPEQTEQLTALLDQAQPEHQRHMQAAMEAHRTAASILEAETPNLTAYTTVMNEAADHMVMAHVTMTRTALEALDLLAPEQREQLDEGMSHGQGMHGD